MKKFLGICGLILSCLACSKFNNNVEYIKMQCGVVGSQDAYVRFVSSDGRLLSRSDILRISPAIAGGDLLDRMTPKGCLLKTEIPAQGLKVLVRDQTEAGYFLPPESNRTLTNLKLHPVAQVSTHINNCGTTQKSLSSYSVDIDSDETLQGIRITENILDSKNKPIGKPRSFLLTNDVQHEQFSPTNPNENQDSFQLNITVEDLAGRIHTLEQACIINVDGKAPKLSFQGLSLGASLSLLEGPLQINANEPAIIYYRFEPETSNDTCACGDSTCGFQPISRQPILWDEGQYKMSICGIDPVGNVSETLSQSVLIDRSSPSLDLQWMNDSNTAEKFTMRTRADSKFAMKISSSDSSGVELSCRVGFLGPQNQWFQARDGVCRSGLCAGQSVANFVPCSPLFQFDLGSSSIPEQAGQILAVETKAVDRAGHETISRATVLLNWQMGTSIPLASGQMPEGNIFEKLNGSILSGATLTHTWYSVDNSLFVFDGLEWNAAGDSTPLSGKGEGLFQILEKSKIRQYIDHGWIDVPLPLGETEVRDLFLQDNILYLIGSKKVWKREQNQYTDLNFDSEHAMGLASDGSAVYLIHDKGLVNLANGEAKDFSIQQYWPSRDQGFFVQTPTALINWRLGKNWAQYPLTGTANLDLGYDYGQRVIFLNGTQQIQFAKLVQSLPGLPEGPRSDRFIDPSGITFQGKVSKNGQELIITEPNQEPKIYPGLSSGWIFNLIANDSGQTFYLGADSIRKKQGDFQYTVFQTTGYGTVGPLHGLETYGKLAWLFRDHLGRVWGLDQTGPVILEIDGIRPLRISGRTASFADEQGGILTTSFSDGIQKLDGKGSLAFPMLSDETAKGFFDPESDSLYALTPNKIRAWNTDRWDDQFFDPSQPLAQRLYLAEDHSQWIVAGTLLSGSAYYRDGVTKSWKKGGTTSYTVPIYREGKLALFSSGFMNGGALQKPSSLGVIEVASPDYLITFENGEMTPSTGRGYRLLGQIGKNLIFQVTDAQGNSILGRYDSDWHEQYFPESKGLKLFAAESDIFFHEDDKLGRLKIDLNGNFVFHEIVTAALPLGAIRNIHAWNRNGLAVFHSNGHLYLLPADGPAIDIPYSGEASYLTQLNNGSLVFRSNQSWYQATTEGHLKFMTKLPKFGDQGLEVFACGQTALYFDQRRGSFLRLGAETVSSLRFDLHNTTEKELDLQLAPSGRIWVQGSSNAYVINCSQE